MQPFRLYTIYWKDKRNRTVTVTCSFLYPRVITDVVLNKQLCEHIQTDLTVFHRSPSEQSKTNNRVHAAHSVNTGMTSEQQAQSAAWSGNPTRGRYDDHQTDTYTQDGTHTDGASNTTWGFGEAALWIQTKWVCEFLPFFFNFFFTLCDSQSYPLSINGHRCLLRLGYPLSGSRV